MRRVFGIVMLTAVGIVLFGGASARAQDTPAAKATRDRLKKIILDEVDWNAVQATDWRQCKEGKQAEFLLHEFFPWHLVERVGVHNRTVAAQVNGVLQQAEHRPPVVVEPSWYY